MMSEGTEAQRARRAEVRGGKEGRPDTRGSQRNTKKERVKLGD